MGFRSYIRNNLLNKIETPITTLFHKLRITPNMLSIFGLILGGIAALFIALDNFLLAALFWLFLSL